MRATLLIFSLQLLFHFFAIPEAHAQGEVCADTYEGAQRERLAGRLLLARSLLDSCIAACPDALKTDCVGWKTEVEAALPSLTVIAENADGEPLRSAQIVIVETEQSLTNGGPALKLDPGTYTVRVTADGKTEERLVRLEAGTGLETRTKVTFAHLRSQPVDTSKQESPKAKGKFPKPIQIVGMSLLAASLGLTIAGHLQASSLRESCAPNCTDEQVAVVSTLWWTGVGAAAAGATLFGIGYVGEF